MLECGCLGYVGFDGAADTNILIRTFTLGGGWMQFPVGGGIVADSDPVAEYAETLHKAEGLLRALGLKPDHPLRRPQAARALSDTACTPRS